MNLRKYDTTRAVGIYLGLGVCVCVCVCSKRVELYSDGSVVWLEMVLDIFNGFQLKKLHGEPIFDRIGLCNSVRCLPIGS
jgi:hypothetical protein